MKGSFFFLFFLSLFFGGKGAGGKGEGGGGGVKCGMIRLTTEVLHFGSSESDFDLHSKSHGGRKMKTSTLTRFSINSGETE